MIRTSTYSRLFYLYQDTWLTYIKEESFFSCLTWLCHALCGMVISTLVGENLLLGEYDSSITYSNCARFHIFLGCYCYVLFGIVQSAIALLNLFVQIAVFMRQKQLSKQSPNWVVMYCENGVRFEKKMPNTARVLWKHNRNVVSPFGGFVAHSVSIIFHGIMAHMYFDLGPSGPPIIGQFLFFSKNSVYFFGLNFIETMCSPTLRNSLCEFILCWRH